MYVKSSFNNFRSTEKRFYNGSELTMAVSSSFYCNILSLVNKYARIYNFSGVDLLQSFYFVSHA